MAHSGRRIPLSSVAAALLFAVFWVFLSPAPIRASRSHDFLNLYHGARLAAEGAWSHLYEPGSPVRPDEETVTPLFVRPAFYAALLAPLGKLPFGTAHAVWLTTWALAYAGVCRWAAMRFGGDHLVFGAMFLPAALGIAHGEDCILLLLVVIGSYSLRRRAFLSGVLLSLGLVKFHLFLLFPLAIAAGRRWRMLGGFSAGAAAAVVATLAAGGTEGAGSYIRLLLSGNPLLEPSADQLLNIRSLLLNVGIESSELTVTLTAVAAMMTVGAVWRAPDWRWYCGVAAGSLLCVPHTYGYDATYLLPGLWLTVSCAQSGFTRAAAALLCTPLPWAAVLAGPPWGFVAPACLFVLLSALVVESVAERIQPDNPHSICSPAKIRARNASKVSESWASITRRMVAQYLRNLWLLV